MEEISNKTIAALLVVAMVLSLSGTFFSLNKLNMLQKGVTGYATAYNDNATATLTLSSVTSIIYTTNSVDWGTGSVDTSNGYTECNLTTSNLAAYSGCSNFNAQPAPLVLENDGTVNVKVNITANETPSSWIGGTNPGFYFVGSNNEANSCDPSTGNLVTTETALSTSEVTLCENLTYDNGADALNIDLKAQVPYDAPTGSKIVQITAYAEAN